MFIPLLNQLETGLGKGMLIFKIRLKISDHGLKKSLIVPILMQKMHFLVQKQHLGLYGAIRRYPERIQPLL